jgi:hypothetical protein
MVTTKVKNQRVQENSSPGTVNNLTQNKEYKLNDLMQKFDIERFYSPEELENRHQEDIKKQQSVERCYLLYEKGKIKNEINRIMYQKNEELKVQNELEQCTWKPHLNKLNKKMEENLKLITKDTKIYNRSMNWKFKNKERISKSKSIRQRDDLDNPYKPNVNKGF